MSCDSEDNQYIKILAFGDSLTEGYYNYGLKFHPYSEELGRRVDSHFAEANKTKEALIHNRGFSGYFTEQMVPCLHGILEKAELFPYSIACILGGTNDLSSDDTALEVFARLRHMYEMLFLHNQDVVLVAVTIPEAGFLEEEYVSRRTATNNLIKEYCDGMADQRQRAISEGRTAAPHVICVDLEPQIPYFDANGNRSLMYDDALHFSPAGYDEFGRILFDKITAVLDDM